MSLDDDPGAVLPRLGYTVREVATSLGVAEKTIRRLIRAGDIRARWTGHAYIIPRTAIEDFLRDGGEVGQ